MFDRQPAIPYQPIPYQNRIVVISIKTSQQKGFAPKNGDRITQIACQEILDGKVTRKQFFSYVKPEDPELVEACNKHYQECGASRRLKKSQADTLIKGMENAPYFKDIQNELLKFLNQPNTSLLAHTKKYVLDFLRHSLDEAGNQILQQIEMVDMASNMAALSHQNLYAGGRYPRILTTGKETLAKTRSFYKFEDICSEMGVHFRNRSGYDAKQDALLLAKAECNRLSLLNRKSKLKP